MCHWQAYRGPIPLKPANVRAMNDIEHSWRLIANRLGATHDPSPLYSLPRLAAHCGVGQVLAKDESARPLGNFKVLGGIYAGLCALVRESGEKDIAALLAHQRTAQLPPLICASDGNHGLAVAVGAKLAGAEATVYLHERVSQGRAERIAACGGTIIWVKGSYDDAVSAAAEAAAQGGGLLIADTASTTSDPAVGDVMRGYSIIANEIGQQLHRDSLSPPTHLFIQAGVGGLAAAMTERLAATDDTAMIVVEPEGAACVGAALSAGFAHRIPGSLETVADMLSCGEASAPALQILLRHSAYALSVSDATIERSIGTIQYFGGPATTASGATGMAGLLHVAESSELQERFGIGPTSRVLVIVTEGVHNQIGQ